MSTPASHAVWDALLDADRAVREQRYEGFQAGGGGLVARQAVTLDHCRLQHAGSDLAITFNQPEAQVEASVTSLQLPRDWRDFSRLQAYVAAMDLPLTLDLVVLGARCRLIESVSLVPGQPLTIDLDLFDLPLAAGIRPLFEPAAVRLVARWHPDAAPRAVRLASLTLIPDPTRAELPRVDAFGQRISTTWPGKITSLEDLIASGQREADQLAAMPPHPDRNRFGGWTGGPRFKPTGFFRTQQDHDARWWLVDPEGCPFYSIGVTGIRVVTPPTVAVTPVHDRAFLYTDLPDPAGPFASAYNQRGFGHYHHNILRKYGSIDAWRDRNLQRLRIWGMNTVACWSDPVMLQQQSVPHVRFIRSNVPRDGGPSRRFPDVFDPAWEQFVDELMAAEFAPHRNDPMLIGCFVDNEWPWGNMKLPDAPAEGPGRIAAEQRYAHRYFSTIARLLRKHDPNHLYLGCRFVRKPPPEHIVAIAGEHVDVLSVNCYALYPERSAFADWHRMSGGKPILMGEHHLPLLSPRQLPPLYRAFTPEERRAGYIKFVHEWAAMPFTVGCHWYQHADQPLTGRASDGEDQVVGFVDITDQPHAELVAAVREATAAMYDWHAASK